MQEKRKCRRHEIDLKIKLRRLNGGALEENTDMENAELRDLSKSGLGFFCKKELEIGSFYDAKITLWTMESMRALFEIVRCQPEGDGYVYGGMFVALSDADAFRIDVYEMLKDAAGSETDSEG
jgi:hypothetical protein